jgi:3' terminal RNA ribose 2'-O-methyltransferase Hen1
MVGDGPIAQAEFLSLDGDFFEGHAAVAPSGMVVEGAFELRPFDEAGKLIFFGGGDFAVVFAEFGRDVNKTELMENFFFGAAGDEEGGVAGFDGGFEKAVFVQAQAAFDGALAHDNVVFLAAGEVSEGEGKFGVADDAEIGLNAAFDNDGGFGFAVGADAEDGGLFRKKVEDFGRFFGGGEEVDVTNNFFVAAQTAGGTAADDIGVLAEIFEEGFGGDHGVAEEMARGVLAAELDAGNDVGLGFGAEAGELRDFILLTGFFQLFQRGDAELVVHGFDFFRTDAGDGEHLDEAGRDGGFEFVVVGEFSRGEEFADFEVDFFADAFDFGFGIGREKGDERLADGFEGAGGIDVGAGFEGVLAFEFEEGGYLGEDLRDLLVIHGWKINWKWRGGKLEDEGAMLLTLTTTFSPATDLGFLLHKNPGRVQAFTLSFGTARVFYPEATAERCTVALQIEVDPVGLVRNRRGPAGEGGALEQYVNDRPYAASSFLSVAIAEVFGSALSGSSKERPELVNTPMPLTVALAALPCRGGEEFLRKIFEPLGYAVTARRLALDEKFPDWGESAYHQVELANTVSVQVLLTHLYVLVPVLDNDKHYWVGDAEVEKLLRHGEGWLGTHPEREAITRRYLKNQRSLVDEALERLVGDVETAVEAAADLRSQEEEVVEKAISLNEQRLGAVLAVLKASGARRVLDLGCGEGRLLQALLKEKQFAEIVGMDVSHRVLEMAQDRLHYERMPELQRQRLKLLHGSLIYRDQRLAGFDAAAVVEVIEHLDPPRLAAFERVLFECARPATVVITTPNREYNVKWETLPAGKFRHRDHRFEWTRKEFQEWAKRVADKGGYDVRFLAVGPEDLVLGSPTQMGVFERSRP